LLDDPAEVDVRVDPRGAHQRFGAAEQLRALGIATNACQRGEL
jgi:hypothetical protein